MTEQHLPPAVLHRQNAGSQRKVAGMPGREIRRIGEDHHEVRSPYREFRHWRPLLEGTECCSVASFLPISELSRLTNIKAEITPVERALAADGLYLLHLHAGWLPLIQ